MFGWLEGLVGAIVDAMGSALGTIGTAISNAIWNTMLQWFYETIYGAVADFFTSMGNMGAEIFDLNWVKATILLFTYFGWALFAAGVVVAIFDVAIEYQSKVILQSVFTARPTNLNPLVILLILIAFAYCVIKIFFQNIKRGGILLIQMAVGSLYMFSVPRGYTDGFVQWVKQMIATCLTAFLQTTLLYLGLMTFQNNMLLGLGIMLAANEVPRIAQQFGLDSSAKFNAMSVVYGTSSAVNLTRNIMKATGK